MVMTTLLKKLAGNDRAVAGIGQIAKATGLGRPAIYRNKDDPAPPVTY